MKFKNAQGEEIEIDDSQINAIVDEAVKGLKNKNSELLTELKAAKKNATIDPEDYNRLRDERDDLQEKLSASEKATKAALSEADKIKKSFEQESGFTSKLLIENGLQDSLLKAGVKKELIKAASALFSQQAAIVADGDSRKAMIGDKPLADVISEWSKSDEGKFFVAAADNAGGNSTGGAGGSGNNKTVTWPQFEAMSHSERSTFAKSGGSVVDG